MSMTLTLQPLANHHVFADLGSDAFDLLLMRMEALQLEPNEVRRKETSVFAELVGACAKCKSNDRCEQDLGAACAVEHDWERHCPNAATFSALAALPWFGKTRTKATS